MTSRVAAAAGALLFTIGLYGCADSGPPPPTQAQQLCRSWGYDPNDACLRTFRRDPP